jgi:hypothetical protein
MALFSVLMHDIKMAVAAANTPPGMMSRFYSPVLLRDFVYCAPMTAVDIMNPLTPPGYVTHPTEGQAWEFARQAEDAKLVAYDIETPRSSEAEEDESDELEDRDITSIQFSLARGTGIFLPWREEFIVCARQVLATRGAKAGCNNWRFDDPLLEAHGCRINGERHDVRWAWHSLQPDLRGALQFIASFYTSGPPWKHTHSSSPAGYGIRDVDVVQEILT